MTIYRIGGACEQGRLDFGEVFGLFTEGQDFCWTDEREVLRVKKEDNIAAFKLLEAEVFNHDLSVFANCSSCLK